MVERSGTTGDGGGVPALRREREKRPRYPEMCMDSILKIGGLEQKDLGVARTFLALHPER